MLTDRQKILVACVTLPLLILLVNSTLAFQVIARYQALVATHIQEFRESKDEEHLNRIDESSQAILNRSRMMLVMSSVISILICTIVGFLVSRQLVGGSYNLSKTYLQRELKFARERIDVLINMLEKQEESQE